MNQDPDLPISSPGEFSHEELVYALEKISGFDSFLESIIQHESPTQLIMEGIRDWFLEQGFTGFGIQVDFTYENYQIMEGVESRVFNLATCPANHYRYLLSVSGRCFGKVILRTDHSKNPFSDEFYRYFGNLLMEGVDNLLYMRGMAIIKQQLIQKIQDEFQSATLGNGIHLILKQLLELVDFTNVLIVFEEFDFPSGYLIRTLFFEKDQWIRSESAKFHLAHTLVSDISRVSQLNHELVQEHLEFLDFRAGDIFIAPQKEPVGKVYLTLGEKNTNSFLDDILEILIRALEEVLTRHFKDKTNLSRHFSPGHVERLLDTRQKEKHLAPSEKNCGIIYADISGFTALSEKVLKTPARIANFVNQWSQLVLEILYSRGGAYDKLVGDCMIGIFGPPFFEWDRSECIQRLVDCSIEISKGTREMALDPELMDLIQTQMPDYQLGVAIGVNYTPLFVGQLGPGRSYSGLSSGMNETARLQGLAVNGEILFLDHMIEEIQTREFPFMITGPFSQKVKNVAEALKYYRMKIS